LVGELIDQGVGVLILVGADAVGAAAKATADVRYGNRSRSNRTHW